MDNARRDYLEKKLASFQDAVVRRDLTMQGKDADEEETKVRDELAGYIHDSSEQEAINRNNQEEALRDGVSRLDEGMQDASMSQTFHNAAGKTLAQDRLDDFQATVPQGEMNLPRTDTEFVDQMPKAEVVPEPQVATDMSQEQYAPMSEGQPSEVSISPETEAEVSSQLNEQQKEDISKAKNPELVTDDPEEQLSIKNEYKRLMAEFEEASNAKNKARKTNALLHILKAVTTFGSKYGAANAQAKSGIRVDAPTSNYKVPTADELYQGPDKDILKQKLAALKMLKGGGKERQMELYERSLDIREKGQKVKEEAEKRRNKQFEFKVGETDKTRATKVVDEFNKDKITRAVTDGLLAADKADRILKTGGKLAPSVMGRLLARMAGEVGVMTDKDVEAFRGSSKWIDSMDRFFIRGITGKLTDEDKTSMKEIIADMKAINQKHLQRRATVIATQFATVNNAPVEQMLAYVQPGVDPYLDKPAKDTSPKPTQSTPAEVLSANEKIMRDPKSGRNVVVDKDTKKVLRWAK
jgi:hypothetical protein